MKKVYLLLVIVALFTSCVSQQKSAKLIDRSSPNSKVYVNTEDKHDFIVVTKGGEVKRVKTGGTFSAKIKKENFYQELK